MCRDFGGCGGSNYCAGICGGTPGSVPYQLIPNVTTFATPPTNGGIFMSNGTNTFPYFSPNVPFGVYLSSNTASTPLTITASSGIAPAISIDMQSNPNAMEIDQPGLVDNYITIKNDVNESKIGIVDSTNKIKTIGNVTVESDGIVTLKGTTTVIDSSGIPKLRIMNTGAGVLSTDINGNVSAGSPSFTAPVTVSASGSNNAFVANASSLNNVAGVKVNLPATNGLAFESVMADLSTNRAIFKNTGVGSNVMTLGNQGGNNGGSFVATTGPMEVISYDSPAIIKSTKAIVDSTGATKLQVLGFGTGTVISDASGNLSVGTSPLVAPVTVSASGSNNAFVANASSTNNVAGVKVNLPATNGLAFESVMADLSTNRAIFKNTGVGSNVMTLGNQGGNNGGSFVATTGPMEVISYDSPAIIKSTKAIVDSTGATKLQVLGFGTGTVISDASGNLSVGSAPLVAPVSVDATGSNNAFIANASLTDTVAGMKINLPSTNTYALHAEQEDTTANLAVFTNNTSSELKIGNKNGGGNVISTIDSLEVNSNSTISLLGTKAIVNSSGATKVQVVGFGAGTVLSDASGNLSVGTAPLTAPVTASASGSNNAFVANASPTNGVAGVKVNLPATNALAFESVMADLSTNRAIFRNTGVGSNVMTLGNQGGNNGGSFVATTGPMEVISYDSLATIKSTKAIVDSTGATKLQVLGFGAGTVLSDASGNLSVGTTPLVAPVTVSASGSNNAFIANASTTSAVAGVKINLPSTNDRAIHSAQVDGASNFAVFTNVYSELKIGNQVGGSNIISTVDPLEITSDSTISLLGTKAVVNSSDATKLQVVGFGAGPVVSDASGNLSVGLVAPVTASASGSNNAFVANASSTNGVAGVKVNLPATNALAFESVMADLSTNRAIFKNTGVGSNVMTLGNQGGNNGGSFVATTGPMELISYDSLATIKSTKAIVDSTGATKLQVLGFGAGGVSSDASGNLYVPSAPYSKAFITTLGSTTHGPYPTAKYIHLVLVAGGGGGGGRETPSNVSAGGGGGGGYTNIYLKPTTPAFTLLIGVGGPFGFGGGAPTNGTTGSFSRFSIPGETGDIVVTGGGGGKAASVGSGGEPGIGGGVVLTPGTFQDYVYDFYPDFTVTGGSGGKGNLNDIQCQNGGGSYFVGAGGAEANGGSGTGSGAAGSGRGGAGGAGNNDNGGNGGSGCCLIEVFF